MDVLLGLSVGCTEWGGGRDGGADSQSPAVAAPKLRDSEREAAVPPTAPLMMQHGEDLLGNRTSSSLRRVLHTHRMGLAETVTAAATKFGNGGDNSGNHSPVISRLSLGSDWICKSTDRVGQQQHITFFFFITYTLIDLFLQCFSSKGIGRE
ncbi:hypothetical protein niasHT_007714 [Heterodera trifolii]|uniref:Uncharacterized protein n=1 Tax=Heterodera trifolii TaxID=157864 RepID=A0ABD2MAA3_9BILA